MRHAVRPFLAAAALMVGCATQAPVSRPDPVPEAAPALPPLPDLALVQPWPGPFGGLPPFDRVAVADFRPAVEAAMDRYRGEIQRIASRADAPTFENTIAALEDAGRVYGNVMTVYGIYSSALADEGFQALERELSPVLAAFRDEITQNEALFRRIDAVASGDQSALTAEQKRLVWLTHLNFVMAGARLDAGAKRRVAEINKRLATLYTTFSQNVLADEERFVVWLTSEADLAGLPGSVKAAAAAAAEQRGKPGQWAITNTRSSVDPFLTFSSRRDLREQVWKNFVNRGDNGDEKDTNRLITEILALRAERANLLGFPTHAHWRLERSMARTPERAMALMESVWGAAVARVKEEVRDMQAMVKKEKKSFAIAPWDYRYYMEKVRKAKYDLDANELKPYLQLEKLREGMFFVAGELFGFEFRPLDGVPVYHPDVRVWEVVRKGGGEHVGVWYFDPYARKGKRSGAWMNAYRRQERFSGPVTTIVSNNANFIKGAPGSPVLVSWDDARTLFHEFGHALHGLASDVTYPSVSGTSVFRDYVEFPSQILENWLATPEVLNTYALHVDTGEPIPPALVEKVKAARTFNQGFDTVEYLASALVDMKLHLEGTRPVDPDTFERSTLAGLGMPGEIVMRHRTPHFLHVFGGDGYSAGYYSYLWSETLSADAFEAFTEAGGPYDKAVAARLVKEVFSVGNTVDPAEGYRRFRGRDVDTAALMRDRGFPVPPRAPAPAPARASGP